MVLINSHGFQISIQKRNLDTIGYACFADLKKLKQKSFTWIKTETRKINFVECYAIWLKDDVCAVANIGES